MSPSAIVLVVFGGLLAFASIFWIIGRYRAVRVRGWVRTPGMVVNRHGGLDGWPERWPTFEWADATGRRHRLTSGVNQSLGPRPGTPVWVLYDPSNPHRGQMDTFVQSGKVFTMVAYLIAGLGLVGCSFALWIMRVAAAAF